MSYDFTDAAHVLGMDEYLRTDDDTGAEWTDYGPQDDETGQRHVVTIAWDGDPGDAKWYASTLGGLATRHIEGCVVTYTDATQ